MRKSTKAVEVEVISQAAEIREVLQIIKEVDEESRLSPEEKKHRRNEKIQAAFMMTDAAAEHTLRDKKATDVDLMRVHYKYQNDARSIFMNKNRVIRDPAPNSRPHKSRAQMRRAYAMASAQAATPADGGQE